MNIIQIENTEYVELEGFSKPIFILLEGLQSSDLDKLKLMDGPKAE